ncbi:NADPH-dependent FMN reductase [Halomonas sp. H5]|uniref:NADPH-dependent FMN reductase n=1 Tax=Halomonas sp. H5 TaxID=3423910 RepID=UPI003D35F779
MSDTPAPRILVFAGSTRRGSHNTHLARLAAEYLERHGARVTRIDLKDYPLPLYDGDLEAAEGLPPQARRLQALLAEHQGLLIASPEYNGFPTPLLKNTLDWMTRPDGERSGLALFADKVAAVVAASPGALGGMRSLGLTRQLLGNLGVMVLPNPLALPRAAQAFGEDGDLEDAAVRQRLDSLCRRLASTLNRLHPADDTTGESP